MEQHYGKTEITFAALAGVLYTILGMYHIAEGIGIDIGIYEGMAGSLFIPGDILGGFCLVVTGGVFLYGFKEMMQGINAGVSFLYVGILMSLLFMMVYLLIMGGNLLDSFIVPQDYEGWSIMETFRPGIYLGILSLAGILYWKDRFSLNEVLVFREGA
ncbi:hypothetical protein [Methanolobus psychrotolerans]|uniref:hypothetical protein n=1 Tax=Methanolobus psychrotolerans TaxID=1874706 RepID=UPI000B91BDA3|nr:hypothetical protein [Methanolobus psychrotolerans]